MHHQPQLQPIYTTLLFLTLLCMGGCPKILPHADWVDRDDFYVQTVRLHPTFTEILPADVDRPARVNAYVEMLDQFEDPIKATGTYRFDFHQVDARNQQDKRGRQFATSMIAETADPAASQRLWDEVTRCFIFTLELPPLPENTRRFELAMTFTKSNRLECSLILELPKSFE